MRGSVLGLCLLSCVASAADAPAPKGLDLIQARYAGTWHIVEEDFDTAVSRKANKEYSITRDCAVEGAVLDCKLMVQGTQQGEQRFSWDATARNFHVDMEIGGHPEPSLTLSVDGNTWIFIQTVHDGEDQPIQFRILRQYHSPAEVSYHAAYSRDGKFWTDVNHGTEVWEDKDLRRP